MNAFCSTKLCGGIELICFDLILHTFDFIVICFIYLRLLNFDLMRFDSTSSFILFDSIFVVDQVRFDRFGLAMI